MLPIYEVILNEDVDGMIINSIVDEPAHRHHFIVQNKQVKMQFNDELREIKGVVLAANQPVYYYSDEVPECYLVFKQKTIKEIALRFFQKQNPNVIDLNHDGKQLENKAVMIESYFAKSDNEFKVDAGSWIATYKILDNELYDNIKQGKYNGFSIDGYFKLNEIKLLLNKKNNIMKIFNNKKLTQEQPSDLAEYKTPEGNSLFISGELAVGAKVYAKASDGEYLLAPDGEYIIDVNGVKTIITVNDIGEIMTIVEAQDNVQDNAQNSVQTEIEQMKNDITELKNIMQTMVKQQNVKFRTPDVGGEKNMFNFKI